MRVSNPKHTDIPLFVATTCWVGAMVLTVFALLNQDRFFVSKDLPIASIVQIQRDVSYRNETDLAWIKATENQSFFEGDRISTGPSSTATLSFSTDMFVVVGPDSIVSVSTISQSDGVSYVVNILKGAVKPIISRVTSSKLIVSSGAKSFNIEPGQSVGFQMSSKGVIQEFSQRERFPVTSNKANSDKSKTISVGADFKDVAAALPSIKIDTASLSVKRNPFKKLNSNLDAKTADVSNLSRKFIDPTLDNVVLDSWKKVDLKLKPDPTFQSKVASLDGPPKQALSSKPLLQPAQLADSLDTTQPISKPTPTLPTSSPRPSVSPDRPVVKSPDLQRLGTRLTSDNKKTGKDPDFRKTAAAPKPIPKKIYSDSQIVPNGTVKDLPNTHYTIKRFAEAGPIQFTVEFEKPASTPNGWVGGIAYKVGNSPWVQVEQNEPIQKVTFDSSAITSWTFDKSRQANCSALVTRFYGSENSGEKPRYSAPQRRAVFCSYGEFEGLLPARLSFQNLAKPSTENGYYEPKYGAAVAARFGIKVTRPEDYLALLPLIRGDQSGAIQFKTKLNDRGVFGVATTGIVAEYLGDFKQPLLSDRIRGLLGHSVVFEGSSKAVYSSKGMSSSELKAWIDKTSDSGGKVYLRSKGTLVPISKEFLSQSQEVVRFVKGTSPILYLEKVSILSFK